MKGGAYQGPAFKAKSYPPILTKFQARAYNFTNTSALVNTYPWRLFMNDHQVIIPGAHQGLIFPPAQY